MGDRPSIFRKKNPNKTSAQVLARDRALAVESRDHVTPDRNNLTFQNIPRLPTARRFSKVRTFLPRPFAFAYEISARYDSLWPRFFCAQQAKKNTAPYRARGGPRAVTPCTKNLPPSDSHQSRGCGALVPIPLTHNFPYCCWPGACVSLKLFAIQGNLFQLTGPYG